MTKLSSSLYWAPTPVEPYRRELPFRLKKAIAERFWEHDGSIHGDKVTLDANAPGHIGYLQGLADSGIDGASELLEAIISYKSVDVWIAD